MDNRKFRILLHKRDADDPELDIVITLGAESEVSFKVGLKEKRKTSYFYGYLLFFSGLVPCSRSLPPRGKSGLHALITHTLKLLRSSEALSKV